MNQLYYHIANPTHELILGSASPRRRWLLGELGIPFRTEARHAEEHCPVGLMAEQIPMHLAKVKSDAWMDAELSDGAMLLTADTIVWMDGEALNKPSDEAEAAVMLRRLSGRMHEVFTAFRLRSANHIIDRWDRTEVYFRPLSEGEISYYVRTCHPLDKAGAYGIQEWMGYVGVERINGCYFNVMGLPLRLVYAALGELAAKG